MKTHIEPRQSGKTAREHVNAFCETKLAALFLQGVKQGWIDLSYSDQVRDDATALLEERFDYEVGKAG